MDIRELQAGPPRLVVKSTLYNTIGTLGNHIEFLWAQDRVTGHRYAIGGADWGLGGWRCIAWLMRPDGSFDYRTKPVLVGPLDVNHIGALVLLEEKLESDCGGE